MPRRNSRLLLRKDRKASDWVWLCMNHGSVEGQPSPTEWDVVIESQVSNTEMKIYKYTKQRHKRTHRHTHRLTDTRLAFINRHLDRHSRIDTTNAHLGRHPDRHLDGIDIHRYRERGGEGGLTHKTCFHIRV